MLIRYPVLFIALELAGTGVTPARAAGQRTWQADLRVEALEIEPVGQASLSVRVRILNQVGEVARDTRLEILVPVGLDVLRVDAGCQPVASGTPTPVGRVTCDVGPVKARELRHVTLVMTRPQTVAPTARLAVFVISGTPDPEPANNYAERALP